MQIAYRTNLNWQFWCFSGLMLGKRIPAASGWGLDVAMPIAFIGMIIPFVKTIPMAAFFVYRLFL
jgi:predicted branched-subunit amino acid permease